MKKNNILWAVLPMMAAALMTTACSNDDNVNESPAQQSTVKTIPYSVTVNDGATTRATVDSDNKTLKFAEGDKLYITGTNIKGTLDIQTGTGTTSATFSGDLTYSGEGSPAADLALTATLVSAQQTNGSEVTINATTNAVTVNYPTTAYCADVATAVQKYSNLTGTSTYSAKSFSLSQQTAFLNFVITFEDGTTSGTALNAVVSNGGSAICTANVTTATDEGVKAKFVLPVASGTTLSGATVTMGTMPALTITNASLTGKVYNVKRTQAVKIVDLGLPSGIKWATMNVGAESVTDRGLYFAWGETTGHAFGSGYKFSLDNYAWFNSTDLYTKYKHDGSSWDYQELASEDDAAAKIWGGVWRMPTKAEWEELLNEDNCTWTWTTDYKGDGSNVAGVIVTSKKDGYTDKSIFLPATGIYSGDNNTGSEIYATYWSKSLYTENAGTDHAPSYHYDSAWKLDILYNAGSLYYRRVQNEYRYYGIGVRAVRK